MTAIQNAAGVYPLNQDLEKLRQEFMLSDEQLARILAAEDAICQEGLLSDVEIASFGYVFHKTHYASVVIVYANHAIEDVRFKDLTQLKTKTKHVDFVRVIRLDETHTH